MAGAAGKTGSPYGPHRLRIAAREQLLASGQSQDATHRVRPGPEQSPGAGVRQNTGVWHPCGG